MQLVHGAQFFNITFLLALLGAADVPVFEVFIILLTCIYASLKSHKIDLIIEVLNLMPLLVSYVPRDSSFSSTQIFCSKFRWLIWCII